jgi:hypothetical protein
MLTTEEQNTLQFYLDNNLTAIPVFPQTKQPCVNWQQYQDFKPKDCEYVQWLKTFWNPDFWRTNTYQQTRWLEARRTALLREGLTAEQINTDPKLLEYDGSISVAVLGGKTSGNLVIFDDDNNCLTEAEIEKCKETTLVVQTKSGHHIYQRMFNPPEATKDGENGELRGEGAYVIAPPSHHVLGFKYQIVSTVKTIKQKDSVEKDKEFMEYAKEKLKFKTINTKGAINQVINQGKGIFLYAWHKRFIENFYVEDNLNELSLKLFAPSIAKTGSDEDTGAETILAWAEKCHEVKGAPLTVDKGKILKMIQSAKSSNITPMSKEGLNRRHPELYKQLVEQGIIIEQDGTQQNNQSKEPQESQANRLFKLFCETSNIDLFHDQNKTEFARIPIPDVVDAVYAVDAVLPSNSPLKFTSNIDAPPSQAKEPDPLPPITCGNTVKSVNSVNNQSKEIMRLDSENFKTYLAHLLFESEQIVANNESITQVIRLLKYDANHAKCYHLFNRVAPDPNGDGSIWIDMADKLNRAYHLTKSGWTIETNVPILFRRYEHQQPLVEATTNGIGDVKLLLPFVNIGAGKDSKITQHRQLLLLIQTACNFIPEIPHPINAMFGTPGSHKTYAQKCIRTVIDPSAAPTLRTPKDENAALQVLDHHYLPIFDNIFYMPQWFSDMLCSSVTGAGQESRALYTNDDPFIRSFKRCVLLNGINLPGSKGDLLSRMILHPTEPSEDRLTEKELDAKFAEVLPSILGGFLDVIVKALNYFGTPEAKPTQIFRLADFTEWGCAIALALGETVKDFTEAMEENLASQNTADIENNTVAEAFLAYCAGNLEIQSATEETPYITTPTGVFQAVESKAKDLGTNTKNTKKWPSITAAFTKKLNDSKNAIIASGWNYDIYHDSDAKRAMSIWNTKATPPEVKNYCSKECGNYDKTPCKQYGKLNQMSEMPCKCPDFVKKEPKKPVNKRYVCQSCDFTYSQKPIEECCQNRFDDNVCGGTLKEEEVF